jgi:hypothetical protein
LGFLRHPNCFGRWAKLPSSSIYAAYPSKRQQQITRSMRLRCPRKAPPKR